MSTWTSGKDGKGTYINFLLTDLVGPVAGLGCLLFPPERAMSSELWSDLWIGLAFFLFVGVTAGGRWAFVRAEEKRMTDCEPREKQ